MSALCNRVYNRDEYIKEFRNNVMPDDFEVSVEVIKPGFVPKYIKKASILGKSEKLDLNVYEIIYDSTSDPRIGLTRDAFRLMSGYNSNKALMFFVPENDPSLYRLSLVTVEPKLDDQGIKVKYEYSNPRRYSFLLGETAKTQTPKRYLFNKGVIKDEKDLFERFNIEVVNKDFFTNIARLFTELVGGKRKFGSHEEDFKPLMKLPSTKDENVYKEFAVRLIGRTVFTWFLKKKVSDKGVPLIPDDLLSLYRVNKTKNFYHSILEPLFFELLNTETVKRKKPFRTKEFDLIPFLNGGLFEPKTEDFYELDDLQNSSKYNNTLVIPDEWFVQFFELLETYNFTLDESSSIDVELSVDPEMLGRIFENLLAEINPETGESARKSTGSFYTPRQIVDYMVDRSLSAYLVTKTKLESEKINQLLKYDTEEHDLNPDEVKKITDAIYNLKVLDPACGSGAFPMGMLNKIMMVIDKFDPDSINWTVDYINSIKDKKTRVAEEQRLYNKDWRYKHKLSVIRNSIFGVDIQPIAADISKLRFFLSLVVDEKINDNEDNRGVLPLPNLEFKFAIANTLIGLPKSDKGIDDKLFQDETEADLKKLIKEYFEASSVKKDEVKRNISELQNKMVKNTIQWKDTSSSYFLLSDFKPFQNKVTNWFELEWMYGLEEGEGFDIVIGNPPYVRADNPEFLPKRKIILETKYYETLWEKWDIYVAFIERGFKLLNKDGILEFIIPDAYMASKYAEKSHNYFINNSRINRIDFCSELNIFEAGVQNIIIEFMNSPHKDTIPSRIVHKEEFGNQTILPEHTQNVLGINTFKVNSNKIILTKNCLEWGDIFYVSYGVAQSSDEKLYQGEFTKEDVLSNVQDKLHPKGYIEGKNVERYLLKKKRFIEWGTERSPSKWRRKTFPELYIHPKIMNGGMTGAIIDEEGLMCNHSMTVSVFWHLLKKVNNKSIEMSVKKDFNLKDDKKKRHELENNSTNFKLGYCIGILNSKYAYWALSQLRRSKLAFYPDDLKKLKIKQTELANQLKIENTVHKVISMKKNNPEFDTTEFENKIDIIVYKLYELDYDEVKIIDPEIENIISKNDYDKFKCFESTGDIEEESVKENEDTEVPSEPTVKRTRKRNTQKEDLFEKAETETDINKIEAQTWKNIATWAKDNDKLEGWERKFVWVVGNTVAKNGTMSEKQFPIAEKIWNKAKEEGFEG